MTYQSITGDFLGHHGEFNPTPEQEDYLARAMFRLGLVSFNEDANPMWSCRRARLPMLTNDSDYDADVDHAAGDAHEFGWVECHEIGDSSFYTLTAAGQVALESAHPY
jgi:hypothetical protein